MNPRDRRKRLAHVWPVIAAALRQLERRHGWEAFGWAARRYLREGSERRTVERIIRQKQKELRDLRTRTRAGR